MKKIISALLCGTMIASSLGILPSVANSKNYDSDIITAKAASVSYGGLYYVNKTFTFSYTYRAFGKTYSESTTYRAGTYVSVSDSGYIYANGRWNYAIDKIGDKITFVRK